MNTDPFTHHSTESDKARESNARTSLRHFDLCAHHATGATMRADANRIAFGAAKAILAAARPLELRSIGRAWPAALSSSTCPSGLPWSCLPSMPRVMVHGLPLWTSS
jgi:hypothetical protein